MGAGSGAAVAPASASPSLKSSVGGSIIWDSPFGPLRGDSGFILTQSSTDKTAKVCASIYCPFFQVTIQNAL
jgi:outer membrane protein insertion porin family